MMVHTSLLVEKKCDALKLAVLALGEQVELALRQSLDALSGQDLGLAREIVDGDQAINQQRRILIQECLLVLAAYEPAGMDLRLVGASLGIIPELERIGDYAADTAQFLLRNDSLQFRSGQFPSGQFPSGQFPSGQFPSVVVQAITDMGEAATAMVHDAMMAYAHNGGDEAKAREVAARDDRVDTLLHEVIDAIVELIHADPEAAASGVALSWIAHLFERAADRATNIAESVVFMATGKTPDLDH
jgi:phosphate transport system protein